MKRTHIIGLILIAAGLGVVISQLANRMSKYEGFDSEYALSGKDFTVVGYLAEGKEIVYDPEIDPNHFEFYLEDKGGIVKKVVLKEAMPRDFERSEEIVVTGRLEGEVFNAEKILLKCPSKYKIEDENISTTI